MMSNNSSKSSCWQSYLEDIDASSAPVEAFYQPREVPENDFEVGCKLAVEEYSGICLGTVEDKQGLWVAVKVNGVRLQEAIWYICNDERLHNIDEPDITLSPPANFYKPLETFKKWKEDQLIDAVLAPRIQRVPEECRPLENLFKVGHMLEVIELRNPGNDFALIPATVVEVSEEKLRIHFDGQEYSRSFQSRDLFPVGYAEKAGLNLQWPPDPSLADVVLEKKEKAKNEKLEKDCSTPTPEQPSTSKVTEIHSERRKHLKKSGTSADADVKQKGRRRSLHSLHMGGVSNKERLFGRKKKKMPIVMKKQSKSSKRGLRDNRKTIARIRTYCHSLGSSGDRKSPFDNQVKTNLMFEMSRSQDADSCTESSTASSDGFGLKEESVEMEVSEETAVSVCNQVKDLGKIIPDVERRYLDLRTHYEKDVEEMKKSYESRLKRTQDLLMNRTWEMEVLEGKLKASEAEKRGIGKQLKTRDREVAEMSQELTLSREKVAELREEREGLEEKLFNANLQMETLSREKNRFETKTQKLMQDKQGAESKILELKAKLEEISERSIQMEAKHKKEQEESLRLLENERNFLAILHKEKDGLNEELERAESDIQLLGEKLDLADKDRDSYRTQVANLQIQLRRQSTGLPTTSCSCIVKVEQVKISGDDHKEAFQSKKTKTEEQAPAQDFESSTT